MRNRGFKQKARRAWKVAESLRVMMKGKDKLPQREAVRHIRSTFGEEFLYPNRNGNPAICRHVLGIFEMFTEGQLVWSWRGRYWRWRCSDDPAKGRKV